jgi:hydroxymethylglutaryl-CoA reductase (NADPH)
VHIANALAAIYLATGQDVACVGENSTAMLEVWAEGGDLVSILRMPTLTVGTVGGGTRLNQQSHHLEMLGCKGEDSAKRFAEIVCAAGLALELSLLCALAAGEFAAAHAKYGR